MEWSSFFAILTKICDFEGLLEISHGCSFDGLLQNVEILGTNNLYFVSFILQVKIDT